MPNGEDAGVGIGCAACTCSPAGGLEEAAGCAGDCNTGGFGSCGAACDGDAAWVGGGADFDGGCAAGVAAGAGFCDTACGWAGLACAAGFSGAVRAGCGVDLAGGFCAARVAGLAAPRLAGPLAASGSLTRSTGISTVASWPLCGACSSRLRRNSARRCSAKLPARSAANGGRLCVKRITAPEAARIGTRSVSNAGGLESWIKRRNSRLRKRKL